MSEIDKLRIQTPSITNSMSDGQADPRQKCQLLHKNFMIKTRQYFLHAFRRTSASMFFLHTVEMLHEHVNSY